MKTLRVTLIVCERSHTILIPGAAREFYRTDTISFHDPADRLICTIPSPSLITLETVHPHTPQDVTESDSTL